MTDEGDFFGVPSQAEIDELCGLLGRLGDLHKQGRVLAAFRRLRSECNMWQSRAENAERLLRETFE